jgi:toxin ParE1/3/4
VATPEIADQMVRQIAEMGDRLADRALLGRARDEVAPGLRSVLRHPYVMFYRVNNGNIEVTRVLHGQRNFAAIFKKDQ